MWWLLKRFGVFKRDKERKKSLWDLRTVEHLGEYHHNLFWGTGCRTVDWVNWHILWSVWTSEHVWFRKRKEFLYLLSKVDLFHWFSYPLCWRWVAHVVNWFGVFVAINQHWTNTESWRGWLWSWLWYVDLSFSKMWLGLLMVNSLKM